jgi:hypothetical protein
MKKLVAVSLWILLAAAVCTGVLAAADVWLAGEMSRADFRGMIAPQP